MPESRKPVVSERATGAVFGPSAQPLLNSNQAAQFLGVHPRTLQRMVRRGEINGVRVGKLWRFVPSSIRLGSGSQHRQVVSLIAAILPIFTGFEMRSQLRLNSAIRAGKSGKGTLMERACYQFGNLTRKKRAKGPDTWEFRYYESTEHGTRRRKSCIVGQWRSKTA